MFEKVLVALDFSVYSQKILDRITEIPGIQEVVLLHVVDATRPSRTRVDTRATYREHQDSHGREKRGT